MNEQKRDVTSLSRYPDESMEDYRNRRKVVSSLHRDLIRGKLRLVWDSKKQGTYRNANKEKA